MPGLRTRTYNLVSYLEVVVMKSLLFIVVLVVALAALGFYRGWFQFSSSSQDSRTDITVSVDKDKMEQDKDSAVRKVEDLGQKAKPTTRRAQE